VCTIGRQWFYFGLLLTRLWLWLLTQTGWESIGNRGPCEPACSMMSLDAHLPDVGSLAKKGRGTRGLTPNPESDLKPEAQKPKA
jgi:hypothetical protein